MSLTNELERLHGLFVRGALTADEYQKAKSSLLEGGGSSESANEQTVPFDWENLAEQAPLEAFVPRDSEVPDKNVLKALEVGAVGGAIIGIALNFASRTPFWPVVFATAFAGAIIWSPISLGVKALERSRGVGATLLRLIHGIAIAVYLLALLGILGYVVFLKLEPQRRQPNLDEYPAAKIN